MLSSRVAAFDDPYPYQTAIEGARVVVLPTAKGRFHAELMQIDLRRLWVSRGRETLPRIKEGAIDPSRAPIVFPLAAPGYRHRGVDVSPGELVVCDWDSAQRVSFAPCHWGAMALPPADLATAGRALAGRELTVPSLARVVRPARAPMRELLSLHAAAAHLARTAPDTLSRRSAARSLEASLVHAMVRCLSEGTPAVQTAGHRLHTKIMRRFAEFLEANPNEPLHLAEICAAVGAPERMLRTCCEEHLGMGPIRYLRLRRMHLARQALLRGTPATATVTGIATEFGFWELGRFSVQYRERFGELPSTTLRRSPRERPLSKTNPFAFADQESEWPRRGA